MRQSDMGSEVYERDRALMSEQEHIDEVWERLEAHVREQAEGYLDERLKCGASKFVGSLVNGNTRAHDKYHDLFDAELMEEYDDDHEGFKTDVLARQCDVIRLTLSSRSEALKDWRRKFLASRSQAIYDTFFNMMDFAATYDEEMDESHILALDDVAECGLGAMQEDNCYLTGVIGHGIVSNILGRMYPRTFPGSHKAGVWSLYFLTETFDASLMPSGSSEFCMIEDVDTPEGRPAKVEHNYFFPYEVYCIYSLRVGRLLCRCLSERAGTEFPASHRFLLSNDFFEYVRDKNAGRIAELVGSGDANVSDAI